MPPDFDMSLPAPPKLTGMNVVALQKDNGERYVFIYDCEPESRNELLRALSLQAADKELSLTWGDAALLSQKARQIENAGCRN